MNGTNIITQWVIPQGSTINRKQHFSHSSEAPPAPPSGDEAMDRVEKQEPTYIGPSTIADYVINCANVTTNFTSM